MRAARHSHKPNKHTRASPPPPHRNNVNNVNNANYANYVNNANYANYANNMDISTLLESAGVKAACATALCGAVLGGMTVFSDGNLSELDMGTSQFLTPKTTYTGPAPAVSSSSSSGSGRGATVQASFSAASSVGHASGAASSVGSSSSASTPSMSGSQQSIGLIGSSNSHVNAGAGGGGATGGSMGGAMIAFAGGKSSGGASSAGGSTAIAATLGTSSPRRSPALAPLSDDGWAIYEGDKPGIILGTENTALDNPIVTSYGQPIGDAVLPLMLLAMLFGWYIHRRGQTRTCREDQ